MQLCGTLVLYLFSYCVGVHGTCGLCSDIALPCGGHVCHVCGRVFLAGQMVGTWRNTVYGLTFLPCTVGGM